MGRLITSAKKGHIKSPNIHHFYASRDKLLILRQVGGLGDIFMQRMMFEDFKSTRMRIYFACPKKYHDAVYDHPFLDGLLDSENVDLDQFGAVYNITSACGTYERSIAPRADKHRSDIWAEHCGLNLTSHNMYINLEQCYIDEAKEFLSRFNVNNKPTMCLCPISAMYMKNLSDTQLDYIINRYKDEFFIFGLHDKAIPHLQQRAILSVGGTSIRQWMGYISAADCVVSVDTAAFHYAGGIDKPLTGIFTFCDGKVYGKYFNFSLVQKHRDNGDWKCGPCFNWPDCPISKEKLKPCLTQISEEMIIAGIEKMKEGM